MPKTPTADELLTLEAAAHKVAAGLPPLTNEQRARIGALLAPALSAETVHFCWENEPDLAYCGADVSGHEYTAVGNVDCPTCLQWDAAMNACPECDQLACERHAGL